MNFIQHQFSNLPIIFTIPPLLLEAHVLVEYRNTMSNDHDSTYVRYTYTYICIYTIAHIKINSNLMLMCITMRTSYFSNQSMDNIFGPAPNCNMWLHFSKNKDQITIIFYFYFLVLKNSRQVQNECFTKTLIQRTNNKNGLF